MAKKGDIVDSYKILNKLGKGGFGMVFTAVEINSDGTQGLKVAVKVEDVSKTRRPQLEYEYRVYRSLMKKTCQRIPQVYKFAFEVGGKQSLNGLIMERLGVNIQQIFDSYRQDVKNGVRKRPFTRSEVFMVADQALECLKAIHTCGFLHRDIKPENFCVKKEDSNRLCIVDFGLSKRFRTKDGKHIPYKTKKGLLGTPRYTSIRCHEGSEQSRRDDLESFLYMILYLFHSRLPWQKTRHKNKKTRYAMILKKKLNAVESGELFRGLGSSFEDVFNFVRNLEFTDEPNYEKIRSGVSHSLQNSSSLETTLSISE